MKEEKTTNSGNGMQRREFITHLVLGAMATSLPLSLYSCKDKMDDGFVGSGKVPYKIWEEILHYIKSSPDNLKGQYESLIKKGNPEEMFHFVRDQFYLIPAYAKKIGYGNSLKYGTEYALRSGMATMYEKALLYKNMLTAAGITAYIKKERTNISPEQAQIFFYRPIERNFNPAISNKLLKRWGKEMGTPSSIPPFIFSEEEIDKKTNTLTSRILKTLDLPEDHKLYGFDFRWPNYDTPVVEFEWEGQTMYAHLYDPTIPFGKSFGDDPALIGKELEPYKNEETLDLELTYRDSIQPNKEKTLLQGKWLTKDVVGNQLNILFLDNLTDNQKMVVPVGNIRTFTPAFSFQGLEKTQEELAIHSKLGQPITLEGDTLQFSPSGQYVGIGQNKLLPPQPDLQKTVTNISGSAKVAGKPKVKLSVTATNQKGELVQGLSASDFRITEDGKEVQAILESNQQTPKILILADGSGSMPFEYGGQGMKNFVSNLKEKILEQFPAAIIQNWTTPSSLFTWLLKASKTEYDLIVYATDGHNDDTFNPENLNIYKSGPPAIILDVDNRPTNSWYAETFNKMAEITNGVLFPVEDQVKAIDFISTYVSNLNIEPYTFTYYSVGKPGERTVTIELDNKRLQAQTTYTALDNSPNSEVGPKIIGVYLRIKHQQSSTNIKRVLAGWDHVIYPKQKPVEQMADEVNDLFLGGVQLYIEGDGPTYSAVLSDLLKAKMSTRDWGEASIDGDTETAWELYKKGQIQISGKALSLMQQLPKVADTNSMTFASGLRIGMSLTRPGIMNGTGIERFDYIPSSRYKTLCNDPKKGFEKTIKRTTVLALREQELFKTTALTDLSEKKWISLSTARKNSFLSEEPFKSNYYYYRYRVSKGRQFRILDESGTTLSYLAIDNEFGELYAVLPSGAGGGEDYYKRDLEKYQLITKSLFSLMGILDHYKLLRLSAAGSLSLGVVALYGELLVKLYAAASEAIMIMDASFINERLAAALAQFACDVAKQIATSIGPVGAVMGGLDTLIGLIAPDDNPFPCS